MIRLDFDSILAWIWLDFGWIWLDSILAARISLQLFVTLVTSTLSALPRPPGRHDKV